MLRPSNIYDLAAAYVNVSEVDPLFSYQLRFIRLRRQSLRPRLLSPSFKVSSDES